MLDGQTDRQTLALLELPAKDSSVAWPSSGVGNLWHPARQSKVAGGPVCLSGASAGTEPRSSHGLWPATPGQWEPWEAVASMSLSPHCFPHPPPARNCEPQPVGAPEKQTSPAHHWLHPDGLGAKGRQPNELRAARRADALVLMWLAHATTLTRLFLAQ